MKKSLKKVLAAAMSLALVLALASPAAACTGVYVGSDVSANGSTFMGRSEDIGNNYVKIFGVSPAADYPDDYIFEDTYGFWYPYGGHTYAYTYVKDSPEMEETMSDEDGNWIFEAYAEAGQNEMGVSMTATVSTSYNAAAKAADPLIDGRETTNEDGSTGLCEVSIGTMILGKCATAKEAVEYLAEIIDSHGSGECNSIMISDPNETWYFLQLSGHQYAAIKMPADKVSVQPNITLMDSIDVEDTENVFVSPNLVSLAEENGFLVTDGEGKINVAKTYGEETSGAGQYVRYYQGVYYYDPEQAEALGWSVSTETDDEGKEKKVVLNADGEKISGQDLNNGVNLLLTPPEGKTYTTLEILQLLGTRGEGTDGFNSLTDGVYSIGNNRQAECHIFETRKGLPAELATIQWETLGQAEYGIYLPYYSALVESVLDEYNVESAEPVDGSIYWAYEQLYNLCYADPTNVGANVKAYFAEYQQSLIDQQVEVDKEMVALYEKSPELAAANATRIGKNIARQYYEMICATLEEAQAYVEAGDFSEAFMPTAAVEKILPVYNLGTACQFEDISGHWAQDAVDYAVKNGYIVGTSDTSFSPNESMTAEMLALVLARIEGVDDAEAVDWAVENGISDMTDPSATLSRGEMAEMLCAYAELKGAVSGETSVDLGALFDDADGLDADAADAMAWLVGSGIIIGTGEKTLEPQSPTNRAEVATVLMRFYQLIEG